MLTNGDASMGACKVDVSLGDGTHADLVKCSREECCECAAECHRAVASGAADGYTHQVLLSDVALDEPVWVGSLRHNEKT